jgi:hypothetical protein
MNSYILWAVSPCKNKSQAPPRHPAPPPDRNPAPAAASPSLTTLSLEAREHRARFIRYILADAALDDPDDQ